MPSTNVPVLSVKNLQIQFNHVPVVRGVSFDLYPGEIFALVGESGSGKSVTALSIMGLLNSIPGAAVQGTITFNQQNLVNCSEESYQKLRGNHISMIFQEPMTALNPVFSIGFQIAEVLKKHQHQKGKELYADIIELLQFVGIPSPEQCYKNYPHQLSGGMRQRVMIAIALACRPQLLIADEPTTALDVTVQAQIMKLIDSLRKKYNTAVLFITHNLALISQYADQCVVMYSGCMMEQAPANLFFTAPRHPYTKMLLQAMPQNAMKGTKLMAIDGVVPGPECELPGCRFASRCPLAMPICRKKRPAMRQIGENHFACCHCLESVLSDLLKKDAAPTAVPEFEKKEPLLCVEDLQVEFPICKGLFKRKIGAVKAVNHIDLNLYPDETLALVGESGCGKTTAGKAIVRLLKSFGGKIIFHDQVDLCTLNKRELHRFRQKIQMVFQDPFSSFNPRLTVGESIREGLEIHHLCHTEKEIQERLQELFADVGMDIAGQYRYPHQFSGGQRQRLGLARALAVNPEIMICDECTSALDVSVQAQILNLLKDLQKKYHLSYLFITHDLSVVQYLADRVAVMYLGYIIEEGTNQEIFSDARHPYTKALLQAAPQISAPVKIKLPEGDIPNLANLPSGCPFRTRCPLAEEQCAKSMPKKRALSKTHFCRCLKIK